MPLLEIALHVTKEARPREALPNQTKQVMPPNELEAPRVVQQPFFAKASFVAIPLYNRRAFPVSDLGRQAKWVGLAAAASSR